MAVKETNSMQELSALLKEKNFCYLFPLKQTEGPPENSHWGHF